MALSVNSVGSSNLSAETNTDTSATVQVGENNLSQVAQRLGIDLDSLQQANPLLVEGSVKPGQNINLPDISATQAPQSLPVTNSRSGLPPAPLGDPMAKLFVQSQLDNNGAFNQVLHNPAQHLMYADPDGSGSGSAAGVSTSTATGAQNVQFASFKSPD